MKKYFSKDIVRRLEDFVDKPDGIPAQYFAGREDFLSDIETMCAHSWNRHKAGRDQIMAATRLIYGPPGAGATSLLMYLSQNWESGRYVTSDWFGDKYTQPVPKLAYFRGDEVSEDPEIIIKRIADLVEPGFDFVADRPGTPWHTEGSLGLRHLHQALPHQRWKHPVVIAIDDAHEMSCARHSPLGRLLREIHASCYELPLTPVLCGRPEAIRRTNEAGVSRLATGTIRPLNRLSADDVAKLKGRFCANFGLDISLREAEFDAMLGTCGGWPPHLTNALLSFCEEFLKQDCEIGEVDFGTVETRSMKRRLSYFSKCMTEKVEAADHLLREVMRQLTGQQRMVEVVNLIDEQHHLHKDDDLPGARLPAGMDGYHFYRELVNIGALHEPDFLTVSCPMPGFRQFILEMWVTQGDRAQSPKASKKGKRKKTKDSKSSPGASGRRVH